MIIVNADDWGRSTAETDAAAACFEKGRITSVTAMMFMRDSTRSAELAKRLGIDVGLHLNLSQRFNGETPPGPLAEYHDRIVRFMLSNKYSVMIYDPRLRREFRYVFEAQLDEFGRLYEAAPSHIDGHHHKHLCMNMLVDSIIPRGEKVRRNFSYWPGEKGIVNRTYRAMIDRMLAKRYRITNYLFSLSESLDHSRLVRVFQLARAASIELMTHPVNAKERTFLMSEGFVASLSQLQKGTYRSL